VERRVSTTATKRRRIAVTGVVQGVGFRPFVHRRAVGLGLSGSVANDAFGVTVLASGPATSIEELIGALSRDAPSLARVDAVVVEELDTPEELDALGTGRFVVAPSDTSHEATRGRDLGSMVPADVGTCHACLAELRDPADRRHGHALITCTDCGPRYTIVTGVPYDRSRTTMAGFAMCRACRLEYDDPSSRRFHAETISCTACGPRLEFVSGQERVAGDADAVAAAVDLLRRGGVLAVKGMGGYGLAVVAADGDAVHRLRRRKHRNEKPFAVLVADLAMARQVAELSAEAERALLGPEAPIVLTHRRPAVDALVALSVAPGSDLIGVMLPPTGTHHLLAERIGAPLVMTSGNRSDEPIAFADDDALERLGPIADGLLVHDRPIARRADDSVVRSGGHGITMMRRARGYAPRALRVGNRTGTQGIPAVLAVGAQLKSTVCMLRGDEAVLSPHIGDLEHLPAFRAFAAAVADLQDFLGVAPGLVVHDLHPEYLSTKWALEHLGGLDVSAVQHHHAHVAACMAEHGRHDRVIGIAFDGHGYGTDGTLWGGELLLADRVTSVRVGHLLPIGLPGGSAAIREPWRMAAAWLAAAGAGAHLARLGVHRRNAERWATVEHLASRPSTMRTTSVGRLLDACAAILGLGDRCSFEAQAAMLLEQAAVSHARTGDAARRLAPFDVRELDGVSVIDPRPMISSLAELAAHGPHDTGPLALAVHRAVAEATVRAALDRCQAHGIGTVVLSGGVFQNDVLTTSVFDGLAAHGIDVLTHRLVPPNDGGISLGQAVIGAARAVAR
jgi:hydrogenase maturation protein HypF